MTALDKEQLKPELFQIVTGNLLGDGNLQKPKGCQFYRFRFSQNYTKIILIIF